MLTVSERWTFIPFTVDKIQRFTVKTAIKSPSEQCPEDQGQGRSRGHSQEQRQGHVEDQGQNPFPILTRLRGTQFWRTR